MPTITPNLSENGFAFVPAREMRALLGQSGSLADWDAFTASWNDLKTDTYMADKGRYRKRRYAVYAADDQGIVREAHQAHFQSLDYNPLNGGVDRWFEPVTDAVGNSSSMQTVLKYCLELFRELHNAPSPASADALSPSPAKREREGTGAKRREGGGWHIEAHQFRIEAKAGEKGQPTPEGAHRDERDYVLVLLIRRENIKSGTTTIYDLDKKPLGSFTLTEPFDAALVDDNRVFHGVTAVEPLDPAKPAYRDVLVVTFKANN